MADPFVPKFYSPIKNNICPNFSERLDFVLCEHSLKVFTLAFGHKGPFISSVSDEFASASAISLQFFSFTIYLELRESQMRRSR